MQGPLGLYRGFGAQWARFGPYVRRIDTLSNSPFHSISCETEMPLACCVLAQAIVQFLVWEKLRYLAGMETL